MKPERQIEYQCPGKHLDEECAIRECKNAEHNCLVRENHNKFLKIIHWGSWHRFRRGSVLVNGRIIFEW